MDSDSIDELRRVYRNYVRCAEIIATVEVWFTKSEEMASTVQHFERFPKLEHHEKGTLLTPDFTVLFNDGTALIGEVSRVALREESVDKAWKQLEAYAQVSKVQDQTGTLVEVSAVDVVVIVPHNGSMRMCQAVAERKASSKADNLWISVFEWSHDSDDNTYTIKCPPTDGNVAPRGHGREPSLEGWLTQTDNSDGLRGRPEHFSLVQIERRFTNDPIPPLYLATILWSQVFGDISDGEADIKIVPADIARRVNRKFGKVRSPDVKSALAVLEQARLARQQGSEWIVAYRELGRGSDSFDDVLLQRLRKPPSGPVTLAERKKKSLDRKETLKNRALQEKFDLPDEIV